MTIRREELESEERGIEKRLDEIALLIERLQQERKELIERKLKNGAMIYELLCKELEAQP